MRPYAQIALIDALTQSGASVTSALHLIEPSIPLDNEEMVMSTKENEKLVFITVTAPAHWASYLVNGDATGFSYYDDPEDEEACYAFEREYGCCVCAEDIGFVSKPDYGQAGPSCEYTFPQK